MDLSVLLEALAEKPLILHGGDYDLRMMRGSMGFRPRREVFDTMVAAQLLGIEQIGLAALIERFFNVTIGKEGQKSDWSRRPLSQMQLRYAVNDTRFLQQLAERLRGELRTRGRLDWHVESCRAMVESTRRDHARDPEEAWRITRRQLAYLRDSGAGATSTPGAPTSRLSRSLAINRYWKYCNGPSPIPACPWTKDLNCRATSSARG